MEVHFLLKLFKTLRVILYRNARFVLKKKISIVTYIWVKSLHESVHTVITKKLDPDVVYVSF